eukprot:Nk52_evm14s2568 gene=Nk52_evmTU14s2568
MGKGQVKKMETSRNPLCCLADEGHTGVKSTQDDTNYVQVAEDILAQERHKRGLKSNLAGGLSLSPSCSSLTSSGSEGSVIDGTKKKKKKGIKSWGSWRNSSSNGRDSLYPSPSSSSQSVPASVSVSFPRRLWRILTRRLSSSRKSDIKAGPDNLTNNSDNNNNSTGMSNAHGEGSHYNLSNSPRVTGCREVHPGGVYRGLTDCNLPLAEGLQSATKVEQALQEEIGLCVRYLRGQQSDSRGNTCEVDVGVLESHLSSIEAFSQNIAVCVEECAGEVTAREHRHTAEMALLRSRVEHLVEVQKEVVGRRHGKGTCARRARYAEMIEEKLLQAVTYFREVNCNEAGDESVDGVDVNEVKCSPGEYGAKIGGSFQAPHVLGEELCRYVFDPESRLEWEDGEVETSEVLERIDSCTVVIRQILKPKALMMMMQARRREIVFLSHRREINPHTKQTILVNFSVDHPKAPLIPSSTHIRAHINTALVADTLLVSPSPSSSMESLASSSASVRSSSSSLSGTSSTREEISSRVSFVSTLHLGGWVPSWCARQQIRHASSNGFQRAVQFCQGAYRDVPLVL